MIPIEFIPYQIARVSDRPQVWVRAKSWQFGWPWSEEGADAPRRPCPCLRPGAPRRSAALAASSTPARQGRAPSPSTPWRGLSHPLWRRRFCCCCSPFSVHGEGWHAPQARDGKGLRRAASPRPVSVETSPPPPALRAGSRPSPRSRLYGDRRRTGRGAAPRSGAG